MASSTAYGGRILLDGTELREAAPESVYELISVIQQNVFVFNASIVENISMFRQFPQAELGAPSGTRCWSGRCSSGSAR